MSPSYKVSDSIQKSEKSGVKNIDEIYCHGYARGLVLGESVHKIDY